MSVGTLPADRSFDNELAEVWPGWRSDGGGRSGRTCGPPGSSSPPAGTHRPQKCPRKRFTPWDRPNVVRRRRSDCSPHPRDFSAPSDLDRRPTRHRRLRRNAESSGRACGRRSDRGLGQRTDWWPGRRLGWPGLLSSLGHRPVVDHPFPASRLPMAQR